MKKVLLSLMVLAGTLGYSQNIVPQELKVSEKEAAHIQKLIDQKKQISKSKKNSAGGQITNEFLSFVDEMYTLNGGSNVFGIFQNPMWQDSTVKEEFTNATQHIANHAVGMVYDPASPVWGANQFDSADAFTVDSVYLLGAYRTPNSIPNPMGDSLIVEVVWDPINNTSTWNTGGISYANASPDDQCNYATPNYSRGTNPEDFMLSGSNKIRTGIALTVNDTTNLSQWYGVEINQMIPGGSIVGVNWYFKSAYASGLNTSDTVFSTVTPGNVAAPNFASRLAQDQNIALNNLVMYFCDPGYFGGHNSVTSAASREVYNITSENPWPSMFPETFNGIFTGIMITGMSTFDLEENLFENNVSLFPNPTRGNVSFEFNEGGDYTLEVVNMLGQTVHSEVISVNGGARVARDFSNLNKGLYIVNMTLNGVSSATKLTIE